MEVDLLYSFTVHARHMILECTMHKLYTLHGCIN